jgi:D-arabinose 1-dehydrogenase-like Zn-dependent alcohol dehydrogenase
MMKAFRIEQPRTPGYGAAGEPEPGPRDVLLRVCVVGYCGTDLSTYRGKNPLVTYPRIPGHEIAATIEAVGDAVPGGWDVGEPVTVVPYTACEG